MTRVISHTDLDGISSWIVLDYFGIEYDSLSLNNYGDYDGEKLNELKEFNIIIMTDFSLPYEQVLELLEEGRKVTIIDHHANENSDLLETIKHPNFEFYFDSTKSGTFLAYEYFKKRIKHRVRFRKIFEDFVTLVDIYDLYKTESPLWEEAQNLNRVLYGCLDWGAEGLDKYSFIKSFWENKFLKFNEWFWTPFEQSKIDNAIAREESQYIESMAILKTYTDSKGVLYGVTQARSKISIVAHRILKQKPDIKYLIMINTYDKEKGKISLRSRDENEFSCNSFEEAKGHECAAGGEVGLEKAQELYEGKSTLNYKKVLTNS